MNLLDPNTTIVLTMIIAFLIPLLSALLSRAHWDQTITGLLTVGLSIASGYFTEWLHSSNVNHYDWHTALGLALFSFFVAIASHFGVWQGGSLENGLLAIGSKRAQA